MPPNIICATCGKELSCMKNGVVVGFAGGISQVKGDYYRCNECGYGIITRFASHYRHPDNHTAIDKLDFVYS